MKCSYVIGSMVRQGRGSITPIVTGILLACTLFSCAGNTGAAAGKDGGAVSSGFSGDSTYEGNGSLSYSVGDRHVAIKDYVKSNGKSSIALYVNELKNDPAKGTVRVNLTNYLTQEVLNFKLNANGSSAIVHYSPSFNDTKIQGEFMFKYVNYYADNVTATITDNNATHVSGTFSGTFVNEKKVSLLVTDGKFDIPFSMVKPTN